MNAMCIGGPLSGRRVVTKKTEFWVTKDGEALKDAQSAIGVSDVTHYTLKQFSIIWYYCPSFWSHTKCWEFMIEEIRAKHKPHIRLDGWG